MDINKISIKKLPVCFCICFFIAAANCFAQETSFQIIPGVRVGAITARTGEADLRKIYGSKNVRSGEVGLGEGETVPGTILYPDDPRKRLEIAWKNEKTRKSPEFVQFSGDRSLWEIAPGIGLGTSLKSLEQINGKGFVLLGFEWDYSGTVVSWNGGALSRRFGKDSRLVTLRLSPQAYADKTLEKDLNAVAGDGEFSSGNKSMQRINPRVYFVAVKFP
ncbi:MAG TPA: hypothetical protein VIL74_04100 [Pyrinomonadaceae bacterium]